MMKIFLYSITLSFLLTGNSFAKKQIAKVIKVRGNVSQLESGSKLARRVSVGEILREDTSIVTGTKSFIRLEFFDKTIMNVGARSKVALLESRKDGTSFVHLLKGTLRSKVLKSKNGSSKHKYYLKTRSAAMAVRGTDFQAVYNPENNVSSLLTYKGEVAMAKVEEDPANELKRLKKLRRKQLAQNNIVTNSQGDIEYIEKKPKYDLEGRMDQALSSDEAVTVKRGQYSGTVNTLKRASLPVVISPVQLGALYQNDELHEKVLRSEVKGKKLNLKKQNYKIKAAKQSAPPTGFYEKKTGAFAPRAGGLLDLSTGLYIAPGKDAKYDNELKVFVPSNSLGRIDSETGQYIVPKGLRLDAVDGFVATPPNLSTDKEKRVLLAMANKMNDAAQPKVWVNQKISKEEKTRFIQLTEKEKISKDTLELEVVRFGENFKSTNESGGTSREYDSESGKKLLIRWVHNSDSNWQPITTFAVKQTRYDTNALGSVLQATRDGLILGLGARFNLTNRWSSFGEVNLEQEQYIDSISTGLILKRVAVPKIKLGFQGSVLISGKFALDSEIYLMSLLSKTSGDHKLGMGFGYGLELRPRWWLDKRWNIYSGLELEKQSQDVTSSGFTADNSLFKMGLMLGVGHLF